MIRHPESSLSRLLTRGLPPVPYARPAPSTAAQAPTGDTPRDVLRRAFEVHHKYNPWAAEDLADTALISLADAGIALRTVAP